MSKIGSVIVGTGKYIPTEVVKNENFLNHEFYDNSGKPLDKDNQNIIDKFFEITTIKERRYVTDDLVTSDIASIAAEDALQSSGIDRESLDYIIVAHNFGDVKPNNKQVDIVPSLAARVKHHLKIKNPYTIAYDLPFGCPGWVQGMIQANYYLRSGDVKRIMVIGAETLSRIYDPHDRDGMLYSDGAGATILEARASSQPIGILAHKTRSDTFIHSEMLYMGESYNAENNGTFMKMNGRKLYQYALENVPQTIKDCLDKQGIHLSEINKVLIHQANGKMDDAILSRLFKLYDISEIPADIMPMTISMFGNSSVATIPTLLDIIEKGQMEGQKINKGDKVVFASVGAGMNINVIVYQA